MDRSADSGADHTAGSLLTPSKITAWLGCAHSLTLRHQVERGERTEPEPSFGSFARLLAEKGVQHEQDCLAEYRNRGRSVFEVPARDVEGRETFLAWVDRVGNPFDDGHDVVAQMPFVHDGVRGIADFVVRRVDDATGAVSYEPVDAKLARSEAKPGHVLQLCFYADAIEALTGVAPRHLHVWLGSGETEELLASDFRPYWRRLRGRLQAALAQDPATAGTVAEPCAQCTFCEFADDCTTAWRAADALTYVAGIRRAERSSLAAAGVTTLAHLAAIAPGTTIEGVRPQKLDRLAAQAELQRQARERPEPTTSEPPFRVVEPGDEPSWGHGFELLPEPDEGDVFLDFEGHPFWRADSGLFFLFGYLQRDASGTWRYHATWAHDLDEEGFATRQLIEDLTARRVAHPGMHVYHYNHTERSALETLAAEHGAGQNALRDAIETGMFIDLLAVARNAIQVGVESYGLKHLERLARFERHHDIHSGSGAVVDYDRFTQTHDPRLLDGIAAYNEDDVRATLALRDWLVDHRPEHLPWRVAATIGPEPKVELDQRVAALHAFGPKTPEHLLGDLLGYWLREHRAYLGPKLARSELDTSDLLDDREVITGLVDHGLVERLGARGQPITPVRRFTFPPQETGSFRVETAPRADQVLYGSPDGLVGYTTIHRFDPDAGQLDLLWGKRPSEVGRVPHTVVFHDDVDPKPKPQALDALAAAVLDPMTLGPPSPAALALLRRDQPTFTDGQGPPGGVFGDELTDLLGWVRHLAGTTIAVQGPPGTGKTYRGARLIHALVLDGQRVGITAASHAAIDNLFAEVIAVFTSSGDLDQLRAARRGPDPQGAPFPNTAYPKTSAACADPAYNLVAGTPWVFANAALAAAPVDVLVVDEAGQLALADTLAAARSARNLLLLGDPQQLAQVSQAVHPDGAGASSLGHVLGPDATIAPDRGVFLHETRRMHPDVCRFISEQVYDGRLVSHPSCAQQTTAIAGTGLRWLRAEHADRATESIEEAELVAAEIGRLIGTPWTDQHGVVADLTVDDFLVVSPFNDQRRLLRTQLDADDGTRGVQVGTVDKFQGQEAAVVFFSMATSDAGQQVGGADFLFSRNRLNVAISRARCLAYLVCTEGLLDTTATTVEEMRLLSTLVAFIEHCPD